MATNDAKIRLSAEDRTAAAFAAVGRNLDKLGFNLGTLKGAAVGALSALAVPVSAAAIVGLATEAAKAVDELKDLAEATGSSVESISALDKIARSTGANIDTVGTSLVKFNAVLKDADPTKGPGAVLQALNLDIEELKRLDPAEAMLQTAQALSQWADDGKKARAVQELFGKSVKEAGPFLKDLAEAGRLQATVTTQQAEEVEKWNKQWAALTSETQDFARSVSIDVITALNQVIAKFKEGQKEGRSFLSIASEQYWKNVGDVYGAGAPKGSRVSTGIITNEADQSTAEMARLARGAPPKPSLSLPPESKPPRTPRSGGGASAAPKDPYAEANRYLDSIRKQIDGTQKLSEYEQALRDLQLGRLGKVTPEIEKKILADAKSLDTLRELAAIDKVLADNDAQAASRMQEKADAIQALIDATPTAKLEEQRQVMLDLVAAYEAGTLGITGSAEALALLAEAQQAYLGTAEQSVKELSTFADRAAENIQDFLGSSLQDVLQGNFDNIGDAFSAMLSRMVAEAAAAEIMDGLFGSVTKDGGRSGGGLVSAALSAFGLPSYDGGGFTGSGPRSGGVDGRGGFLGVLHPNEDVIDRTKGQGARSGQTINVVQNFTVGDVASISQVRQAVAGSEARIAATLQRSQKYGGAFA